MNLYHGWLIIDKPKGISSNDAVQKVKRLVGKANKVGHAGTLDPLAEGVLPIAIGEATKTTGYLMDADKEYEFDITWGEERSTGDAEGEVTKTSDFIPSLDEIKKILPEFIGEITQTPPIYSAIKIKGKPAYKLAREGKEVEIPARQVKIYNLEIIPLSTSFLVEESNVLVLASSLTETPKVLTLASSLTEAMEVLTPASSMTETPKVLTPASSMTETLKVLTPASSLTEAMEVLTPASSMTETPKVLTPASSLTRTVRSEIGDLMSVSAQDPRSSLLKQLARDDESVILVEGDNIEKAVVNQNNKITRLRVRCGKGTYVRSLAVDIARTLGSCGYVSYLRRTRVGNFLESDAIMLAKLINIVHNTEIKNHLLATNYGLGDILVREVNEIEAIALRNGKKIFLPEYEKTPQMLMQILYEGVLQAIVCIDNGVCKPLRVFNLNFNGDLDVDN